MAEAATEARTLGEQQQLATATAAATTQMLVTAAAGGGCGFHYWLLCWAAHHHAVTDNACPPEAVSCVLRGPLWLLKAWGAALAGSVPGAACQCDSNWTAAAAGGSNSSWRQQPHAKDGHGYSGW
jgi:hypothetical protein